MEMQSSGVGTTQQGVQVGDILRLPKGQKPIVFFQNGCASMEVQTVEDALVPFSEGLMVSEIHTLHNSTVVNFGNLPFLHPEHVFWFPFDQFMNLAE